MLKCGDYSFLLHPRLAAEQKSQLVGREYTNIKYSAEQAGLGGDPMRTPLSMSSLSLAHFQTSSKPSLANSRTVSSSSLTLPRPPDDIPRSFYENVPKDRKDSLNTGVLAELNIGPPPSFAPPLPPGKPK